ncbi:MAG: spore germination protein GerW family protein [Candidatus Neomarinimicrobiota bacterium]
MGIDNLVKNTLHELQELMASKTVIGEPVNAGEHTVLPVSKVTFGFASGGGGGEADTKDKTKSSGEGIGGGWSIEPVAFVIVGKDGAKLLTIGENEGIGSKIMDLAPKVVEAVSNLAGKKAQAKPEAEATAEE